jgi:VWFA-related protein
MVPRRFLLALAATAVVVLSPAARGQQPSTQAPSGATFRSSTSLVQVDAIIHDHDGRFVLGVTADDVEVYEDGVRQGIEQFYVVMTNPDTGLVSTTGARSARVFLLVFDEADLEVSSLQRIKKGAEQFLMTEFKQGDLGGVVVNGQFYRGKITTDRTLLLAGIRAVKPAFDSRDSRLRPFREFPRIPGEAEAVRIVGGDTFLLRDLGEAACREDARGCAREGGLQMIENRLQQKARVYVAQARDATRYTLEAVQMASDAVASLPGRKTLVVFSDGFFVEESRDELHRLAGMAARAGATIYGIDGRGLVGGRRPPPDVMTRERPLDGTLDTGGDGPEILADGTGGFVVRRMDDVARAMSIVARDTSSYYVIGYRPLNTAMDGTFRKITVKLGSPELSVRARRGYVAPTPVRRP